MADLSPIQLARFWSRVEPASDFQCWEWRGAANTKGYGRWQGLLAHRVAYTLVNGPIPSGLVIRHRCDNPACCNPRHLEVGTQAENVTDCVTRFRNARGSRHGRTKITDDQVKWILANPDGLTITDMARSLGVAKSTVSMIRSGYRRAK